MVGVCTHINTVNNSFLDQSDGGYAVFGTVVGGLSVIDTLNGVATTLADGDTLDTGEFVLRAVHTPGHASNHLCFRHETHRWLFTGDHIMNGSTVVIDPPDGNMKHYLESLERLKALELAALAPGHGDVIDSPLDAIDWLIGHRLKREAKVVSALETHPGLTLTELTPHVYSEVDPGLHSLASRSLLAHLGKLEIEKRAFCVDERWLPN